MLKENNFSKIEIITLLHPTIVSSSQFVFKFIYFYLFITICGIQKREAKG